jgi:hypothetical protein
MNAFRDVSCTVETKTTGLSLLLSNAHNLEAPMHGVSEGHTMQLACSAQCWCSCWEYSDPTETLYVRITLLHLTEYMHLAQNGPCEAPCLLQLPEVNHIVSQCNTQARLAARTTVSPIRQVVEGEITAHWDVYERLHSFADLGLQCCLVRGPPRWARIYTNVGAHQPPCKACVVQHMTGRSKNHCMTVGCFIETVTEQPIRCALLSPALLLLSWPPGTADSCKGMASCPLWHVPGMAACAGTAR